jgi:hypothetical protein
MYCTYTFLYTSTCKLELFFFIQYLLWDSHHLNVADW